jgi:hypothetical protein
MKELKKEKKNLASDAKKLPPAIINPIISLLTFEVLYSSNVSFNPMSTTQLLSLG